jgi:type IV pilus assembly protein PilV
MFKTKLKSAGFSMLEMLIALLVLSIGLLGVATLQIRGQQFNQVGYLRTQATFLAYDIMDRMRVNSDTIDDNDNADDGAYEHPTDAPYPPNYDKDNKENDDFVDKGPEKTANPYNLCDSETGNVCDVEALKDYDLDNWFKLVKETLPEGEASIAWEDIDGDGDDEYAITIIWANIIDRGDDSTPEEQLWILQL